MCVGLVSCRVSSYFDLSLFVPTGYVEQGFVACALWSSSGGCCSCCTGRRLFYRYIVFVHAVITVSCVTPNHQAKPAETTPALGKGAINYGSVAIAVEEEEKHSGEWQFINAFNCVPIYCFLVLFLPLLFSEVESEREAPLMSLFRALVIAGLLLALGIIYGRDIGH